jgi:hypothetical protein
MINCFMCTYFYFLPNGPVDRCHARLEHMEMWALCIMLLLSVCILDHSGIVGWSCLRLTLHVLIHETCPTLDMLQHTWICGCQFLPLWLWSNLQRVHFFSDFNKKDLKKIHNKTKWIQINFVNSVYYIYNNIKSFSPQIFL